MDKFKLVAEAVWKVAPGITLITTSTGAAVKETDPEAAVRTKLALHLELAAFAHEHGQRIMFDSHSFKGAAAVEGIATFARWLQRLAPIRRRFRSAFWSSTRARLIFSAA